MITIFRLHFTIMVIVQTFVQITDFLTLLLSKLDVQQCNALNTLFSHVPPSPFPRPFSSTTSTSRFFLHLPSFLSYPLYPWSSLQSSIASISIDCCISFDFCQSFKHLFQFLSRLQPSQSIVAIARNAGNFSLIFIYAFKHLLKMNTGNTSQNQVWIPKSTPLVID